MKTFIYFALFCAFTFLSFPLICQVLNSSLIAYYPFEGNAKDRSFYINNGIIFGNPQTVRGISGCALFFDGVDDYIQIPNSASLKSIKNEFTITGWAFPMSLYNGDYITLLTKGNTSSSLTPFSIIYRTNNLYPYLRFTGTDNQRLLIDLPNFPNSLIFNQWNFITWRFKDGFLDIFLNANKVAEYQFQLPEVNQNNNEPLEFARDAPGVTEFYHGIFDEFYIYNKALSDQDILISYQAVNESVNNSTVTIDTAICMGKSYEGYNTSGTYRDTLNSSSGCDSIRTINLKILPYLTVVNDTASICQGESYNGYTAAGIYKDTMISRASCNVNTLSLTVIPVVNSTESVTICTGEKFKGYNQPGIYKDTLKTTLGCDSIHTTNLTVIPAINTFRSVNVCEGENYEGRNSAGIYNDTLTAKSGCDSIITLELIIKRKQIIDLDTTICKGSNYAGYTLADTYIDSFLTKEGCDSIRTLNLTIKPAILYTLTKNICSGEKYESYALAGIYKDTFKLNNGCDSIRILDLKVSSIFIPNAFSPNNDGVNDYFEILSGNPEIKILKYQIFDRWGSMIYEANNFKIENSSLWWNGAFKSKPLNNGIFVYSIELLCEDFSIPLKGDILLLRN